MPLDNKRKYVDYEGLKLFKSKFQDKVQGEIGSVREYVDSLLEGAVVDKQAFYVLDSKGDRIPIYAEASGEASGEVVYYWRSGNGSISNPYVYTPADPQPQEGTELEPGLYYKTEDFEITVEDTGDPVIDPDTGEPVYIKSTLIDGPGEIPDPEIRELFEEGE